MSKLIVLSVFFPFILPWVIMWWFMQKIKEEEEKGLPTTSLKRLFPGSQERGAEMGFFEGEDGA